MRAYTYENGRRYHAFRHDQYPLPNDEEERDRLAIVHYLFCLAIGSNLFCAPITQQQRQGRPERILDLGTGTGS